MSNLTLTADQDAALDKFVQFLMDPMERVFVLCGYSGTGKSTLVHTLLERLPGYIKTVQLIDSSYPDYDVMLTATTNKAAETFRMITGMNVGTIHSALCLRLNTDYRTGEKKLVPYKPDVKLCNKLLFIDEASYINPELLGLIFSQTQDCKIVFIGDPGQLLAPKAYTSPVFDAKFPGAMLTQVMRQMVDGIPQTNPITELATLFRHTVNTGKWPAGFKPDGEYVIWLPRDQFVKQIEQEFTRPDWSYRDSKILAWTNNTVIAYNKHIRALLKGDPQLQVGDYAENNNFVQAGKQTIKTDQTVFVTKIEPETEIFGVKGHYVEVDYAVRVFHPHERGVKTRLAAKLRANGEFSKAMEVDNWIDLRAVFAQTVNKSQGSTYGKVFLDLDDIKRCNSGNQIARMMYVGISRAQNQVFMTGDLV